MSGPLVVVVDPDPVELKRSAESLTTHRYSVITAMDGRRGLAAVRAHAPKLLVTEVLMPEMDGIELITAMRRSDPATPIIAVSSKLHIGTLELLNLAKHVGASATLAKPFTGEDLAGKVAELLEGSQGVGDQAPSRRRGP